LTTVILGALALVGTSCMACAQAERQTQAMKNAKERPAVEATPGVSKQKKLSMCLETWDAQTHMTKKEWSVACARSIQDYPDAFER